jgi:hypothetical protein
MSQDTGRKPGDDQGNGSRGNEGSRSRQYEGFEGMNYEQIRQPYRDRSGSGSDHGQMQGNGREGENEMNA